MNLKNWGRIGGLFGAVVLFSAVFNWLFVTGTVASAAVITRLVLGVGGVAFWLVTNRGENPLGRGAFFGTVSAVSAAVLIAALIGINYAVVKKPKSWDLTKDKIFTLSDQTVGVLKGLKSEVKVQAFYAASEPEFGELKARLDQYKAQTDKLSVDFVDPFKHPGQVKELNISQSGPRIIVKSGNKETRAKEITEEALTNALIDVTKGSSKKIYFTKGHGEHAVADNTERGMKQFVDSLKSEGYQTDEIVLAEHKEMPADAQALVIAGPVASLQEGEAKLTQDWVNKGGKLVAMIDPGTQSGLEKAFESWGVKLGNDEVIDPEAQNPEVAIAQQYTEHAITAPRSSPFQLATIFPVARSVSKLPSPPAGWTDVELAKTGPNAWGETSSLASGKVQFDPGQDLKGPVPLAVAATHGSGDSEARVVVIGNSLFASNNYYRLSGNKDFALNSVSWTAKEESKISIRPKQRQSNHLFLSADQKHLMTLWAFDVLPFGLLFAGLVVWQTRKSR
ncbi:MAG TPA: DUF4350 domain-containing protein [Myxococcales bacterium]|nr:DUF4350 domain-containing protein [Myxococcales bacterium]